MIDVEKVNKLLLERKTFWKAQECLDGVPIYENEYTLPLLNALGDDEEAIKDFIRGCSEEDLLYMTEIFEDIYEKFLNDDMYDFLDEMEIKAGLHE